MSWGMCRKNRASGRHFLFVAAGSGLLAVTLQCQTATAKVKSAPQTARSTETQLTEQQKVLQVLNRFTYGPKPGEVERVEAMGLPAWFKQQLNPASIDDGALQARLDKFPALQLPLERIMENFPDRGEIKAALRGKTGAGFDPGTRAVFADAEARYRDKQDTKAGKQGEVSDVALPVSADVLLTMPSDKRYRELCRLSVEQLRLLRESMTPAQRASLLQDFTPAQLEVVAAFNGPHNVIAAEDVQAKLIRDIYTERQLQEVMTDFWLNHFNVYMKKNERAAYYIAVYDRDTIRPYALGKFSDLLMATAASPAMLEYLDNAKSVGPNSESVTHLNSPLFGNGRFLADSKKKESGLNENYARELMELHTIGVNAGYTQHDVTEVARVFTGWTIGRPPHGDVNSAATFVMDKHDVGDKMVLGQKVRSHGSDEGKQVLQMLAASPQCAHFIAYKLAVRFVSDDPPASLVDRMADTYLHTGGNIRSVLAALVNGPEFFSPQNYRAKVKTPLDYIVSAVRAAGADVESSSGLAQAVADLGMPVYGMQTPNGYSMKSEAWNSTNALVSRMNFAMALATNRIAGVTTDLSRLLGVNTADMTVQTKDDTLEQAILHMPVSERTQRLILQQTEADPSQQTHDLRQITAIRGRDPLRNVPRSPVDRAAPDPQASLAAGLIFGSPEFQRR